MGDINRRSVAPFQPTRASNVDARVVPTAHPNVTSLRIFARARARVVRRRGTHTRRIAYDLAVELDARETPCA
jgi:hypothetical protein